MSQRSSPSTHAAEPLSVATPMRPAVQARALPPATQAAFGARFGFDFAQVRVHDDAAAARLAWTHRAQAVTQGADVMFAPGRYAPGTAAGDGLLAHELAHVVQQSQGGAPGTWYGAEARADRAAADAVQGRPVSRAALGAAPVGPQAKPDGAPLLPPPVIATTQTLASVSIEVGEPIAKTNPKLVQIAESYRSGGGGVRVALSADLPRMRRTAASARAPSAAAWARACATCAKRCSRSACRSMRSTSRRPPPIPPLPRARWLSQCASVRQSRRRSRRSCRWYRKACCRRPISRPLRPASLPSLDLDFTFGPVTVSLPKEVRAKLPIPLAGAKKLVVELGFEVPAKFSLKITLDGTPHLRVSLKAGAELDPKNASATASAGLHDRDHLDHLQRCRSRRDAREDQVAPATSSTRPRRNSRRPPAPTSSARRSRSPVPSARRTTRSTRPRPSASSCRARPSTSATSACSRPAARPIRPSCRRSTTRA